MEAARKDSETAAAAAASAADTSASDSGKVDCSSLDGSDIVIQQSGRVVYPDGAAGH